MRREQLNRDIDLSPASPSAFATLAEVKDRLNISVSTYDVLLTSLLTAATLQIEAYVNCVLENRTVTETVDLDEATSSFILRYAPAATLTSLALEGAAATPADYRLNKLSGIIRHKLGDKFLAGNWVIVYTAGHFAAGSPSADVKEAAIRYVKELWDSKDVQAHIQRESVPDVADVFYRAKGEFMSTGPTGVTIPDAAAVMLERYVMRYST